MPVCPICKNGLMNQYHDTEIFICENNHGSLKPLKFMLRPMLKRSELLKLARELCKNCNKQYSECLNCKNYKFINHLLQISIIKGE